MTLVDALELFRDVCDAAAASDSSRILVDCASADGDLSTRERHELGLLMAMYYRSKSLPFKVAVVGNTPLVNGYAAKVSSSHGIRAKTFRKPEDGLYWLNEPVQYRVRMPVVAMLADDPQSGVITIPEDAVIEIRGGLRRGGLIEVRWKEERVRVFYDDIVACCEELQEPDLPRY